VPLSQLLRLAREQERGIPPPIAVSILAGALEGLHAAHEAKGKNGEPLYIVHRDVSPQNVLVGVDGIARMIDFGVAKARGRLQTTMEGEVKGKSAYMAPEQLRGAEIDRRTDVYAASVVLWETLTGQRLFTGDRPEAVLIQVLEQAASPPSRYAPVPAALDAVVIRGLSRDPAARFETARAMSIALESALSPAPTRDVGEWVERVARGWLSARAKIVAAAEGTSSVGTAHSRASPEPETTVVATTTDASSPAAREPSGRRPRTSLRAASAWLLLTAAMGIGAFAWGWTWRHDRAVQAPAPAAVPPQYDGVVSSGSPAVSQPVASTIAAAPATAPGPKAASTARAKASRSVATAAAPSSAHAHCDPPYTLDGAGIRHPKPDCL